MPAGRDIAIVLLVALSGCSRAPDEPVIILSGSTLGREGEILARQIGRFERANPGVHVRVQETPDDATQRHQLYVQWLNARVGRPDVLQLDVVWTAEFAAAGWLAPLDRFAPAASDFFPATIDANRWRGSLYALPWFVDVGMLYRRTDLIPVAPATIAALNEQARAAKESGAVRHGVVWQGARYEGLVTVFLEFLGAFGGSIITPDGIVMVDDPAGIRALTAMRDQIRNGLAPPDVLTWHEEECRFAFQNGTAAFMRNWPYAVSAMQDADSRVKGRFAISPMPAAGGRRTAALGGAQLAISAWSKHPDLAYRLIAFLTDAEQMLERAAVAGQYPARRSVYASDRLRAPLPFDAATVRQVIEAAAARPVTPVYARLSEELQIALHRALTGEVDPTQALETAATRMQQIIDESGLRGASR
jgi:multiple sugar transport system substrate-binding protein